MLNASVESSLVEDEEHNKMVVAIEEALIALQSQESTVSVEPEKTSLLPPILESVTYVKSMHAKASLEDHSISEKLLDQSKNVKDNLSQDYIDIDAVHSDPQFCSLYAPNVYANLRAAELIRRPLPDFMETVQRDITPSMRAILIDCLVEEIRRNVCSSGERTLLAYRQHLFWARGIDTGESGSEVFELSAISTVHQNITEAIPSSTQASFKFLPSMIVASVVFLTRWTLDQSCHPWEPSLQHYSSYQASDLKAAVVTLQDLQINSSSTLNAICEKYNQ